MQNMSLPWDVLQLLGLGAGHAQLLISGKNPYRKSQQNCLKSSEFKNFDRPKNLLEFAVFRTL